MLAAGIGLVTARIRFGPGGAAAALLGYIGIRGTLTLLIGPLFGEITPAFPALRRRGSLVVEAVALLYLRGLHPVGGHKNRRRIDERPITFGALAGPGHRHDRPGRRMALVPRLGGQPLALLPLPRGRDHGPDRRNRRRPDRRLRRPLPDPGGASRRERIPRAVLPVAAVAAVGVIAFWIPVTAGPGVRANLDLNVQNTPDGRVATGTVQLDPPERRGRRLLVQRDQLAGQGRACPHRHAR